MHPRAQIALQASKDCVDQIRKYLKKEIVPENVDCALVGSTYITDRQDSDVDIIVRLGHPAYCFCDEIQTALRIQGWESGGSESQSAGGEWDSYKKVVADVLVNVILVWDNEYYDKWLTAAEVCRFMHIMGVQPKYWSGLVHGVHEIIMDDSTAVTELTRRDY